MRILVSRSRLTAAKFALERRTGAVNSFAIFVIYCVEGTVKNTLLQFTLIGDWQIQTTLPNPGLSSCSYFSIKGFASHLADGYAADGIRPYAVEVPGLLQRDEVRGDVKM